MTRYLPSVQHTLPEKALAKYEELYDDICHSRRINETFSSSLLCYYYYIASNIS